MPQLILLSLVLLILSGSLLGWTAFLKLGALRQQLARQEDRLRRVLAMLESAGLSSSESDPAPAPPASTAARSNRVRAESVWTGPDTSLESKPESAAPSALAGGARLWSSLQEQWMAWLGGLCVALAGIFLVRYSIEQGLLGPAARIVLAVLIGICLHVLAEWLRRRSDGPYPALAALAAGASITLFAALLAALHLYALLPPVLVFGLLTVLALFTMALALLHGPLLAILGLLGAYAVPLLVESGNPSVPGVLLYSLIISAAALALMRRVYRSWLWAGLLAGALGWWLLSLQDGTAGLARAAYLTALVYLMTALPRLDWALRQTEQGQHDSPLDRAPVRLSLALALLAAALSILAYGRVEEALWQWAPLVVLLFFAGRSRSQLAWAPWTFLGLQAAAWLVLGVTWRGDTLQLVGLMGAEQNSFLTYAGVMTALYCGFAGWLARTHPRTSNWLSLALCSPLIWLALCTLLLARFQQSVGWSSLALLVGLAYLGWGARRLQQGLEDALTAWLAIAGHFAYSLAAAIFLREASMTLALAAQLVSLAWVLQRFNLAHVELLLKAVLALVIARLTLNPWLLTYPADVHWSWWSYGGATACAAAATWFTSGRTALRAWLEAATLHLLVLTLFAEIRYWLYDGAIFAPRFELLEMALNTALWSSLALVYYQRAKVSAHLAPLYLLLSRALLILAALGYTLELTVLNPYFGRQPIASTPFWNELLLAYGLPIIATALLYLYYDSRFRKPAALICAFAIWLFTTMQIRHLWQGALDLSLSTGNGELYTYSAVWLLLAVITMLAGAARYGQQVYRGGLALLLLVIAKLFLVDMADLQGLLRVASFMGLGLSLLGLAYLYQRFRFQHRG